MTHSEHVYAMCCRPEVAGGVISGENVNTVEGYAVLNLGVASFSTFQDIKKIILTAAAAADIDDSTRKRICVSLSYSVVTKM